MMRWRLLTATAIMGGVTTMAGCTGGSQGSASGLPPAPTATQPSVTATSPSPSPSLDAKAQAYADAEKAYRSYTAALAALRRHGGGSPTDAQQYTRRGGRAFTFTRNLAAEYQAKGLHTLSDGTIRSVKPKSYKAATSKTPGQVVLVACEQASKSGPVDKTGKYILKIRKDDSRMFLNAVYLTQEPENRGWVVDYFTVVKVRTC